MQQIQSYVANKSRELDKVRQKQAQINKLKRDRRQEWLVDMRLLSFSLGQFVVSFGGVMGLIFLGIVVGGLLAHNFLSTGVVCDQPICMNLRFDQRKLLD